MIEFTCPGCLSRCVANAAFADMRARCVVCGAFIRIPAETGEVAFPLGPVPNGPLPSKPAGPRRPPKPSVRPDAESGFGVLSPDDDDDSFAVGYGARAEHPPEEGPKKRSPKAAPSKAAKSKSRRAIAELEAEADDLDVVDTDDADDADAPVAVPPDGAGPASTRSPNKTEKDKKKRTLLIVGGSVLASIVIVGLLVFTGGDDKPKLPPVQAAERSPDEPPPAPKVAPRKEEPKKDEPKKDAVVYDRAPAPRIGGDGFRLSASLLTAERTANPIAFDADHIGKPFELRGTYARSTNGILYLAEGSDDEGGIACMFPRIHAKGPIEVPPEVAALKLVPGQAVSVRGWYAGNLRLADCRVVGTSGPADEDYRDKVIELVGIVGAARADDEGTERFPTLILEPPATDTPVTVRCLFRPSERERTEKLKPGQEVAIRGKVSGRSYRVVRLHDCALISNEDPPAPGLVRVTADRFFAAYEGDLLPFDRPRPEVPPIVVTPDGLASAHVTDPESASALYKYKTVSLTGRVLDKNPGTRTITIETGTSQKYQITAVFTPAKYAAVKDHKELVIRGVCAGVVGKNVRIENAEASAPDGNAAPRTTSDYFPLRAGQEVVYHLLTPPRPGSTSKDHLITEFRLNFIEPDLIRMTLLQSGTFSKPTLFNDPPGVPHWKKDLTRQKDNGQTSQFRVTDGVIETRDRNKPGAWWDPVYKIGMRKGEMWTATTPDGRTVTYTVNGFDKDAARRATVEIVRVEKNPKDPANWQETTITYALGIGEVRRTLVQRSNTGRSFTVLEARLVEPDAAPPTGAKKDVK